VKYFNSQCVFLLSKMFPKLIVIVWTFYL